MKKTISICLCTILSVLMLCGCGGAQYDESGNASINNKWELVEYTINGSRSEMASIPPAVKIFTASKEPKFVVKNGGTTCIFSVNEKDREGTITDEGDHYRIDFNKGKDLLATINGNELVLVNETQTLEMIFKVK